MKIHVGNKRQAGLVMLEFPGSVLHLAVWNPRFWFWGREMDQCDLWLIGLGPLFLYVWDS